MKDEEYIQLMQKHQTEMRRYKIVTAALLLGIGICLCIVAVAAIVG